MQTIDCENCTTLLTEFMDGELSPSIKGAVQLHLENCEECSKLYNELAQISQSIKDTSCVAIPESMSFNAELIMSAGANRKKHKKTRQFASIAAVFVVFAGSYIAFDAASSNMLKNGDPNLADGGPMSIESTATDELQLKDEMSSNCLELFNLAMEDPAFAADVDSMDLGYGFKVLECNQEEDASNTFVIYFYEDQSQTIKNVKDSSEYLLFSNVRSINWKRNEL